MARVRTIHAFALLLLANVLLAARVSRQIDDGDADDIDEGNADSIIEKLCQGRPSEEFFRLESRKSCKEVVRCDASSGINGVTRLAPLKCLGGLAFDIDRQVCDWRTKVQNCDRLEKPRKVMPLFVTEEPICPEGELACGNRECLKKDLFCNDTPDCEDGSDENACTVDLDPNRADECDLSKCVRPECFCSRDGTRIPGGLDVNQVPQMITITFNGAVNVDNIDLYDDIFNGQRHNPNGCTVKGTFFISHKYTNYADVQELHRKGHEIASFSITDKDDPEYWSKGTYDDWLAEMAGGRLIAETYANITDGSIIGVRAPYLRVGRNKQFEMMSDQFFVYDSTITASLSPVPIWPYTLTYRMPHKCNGNDRNCPTRSYPIWEMVMNELDRRDDPTFDEALSGCHTVDSCSNVATGDQLYRLLQTNFDRHYSTNRAPLGLHFHASWLKSNKHFKDSLIKFIEDMNARSDVYFVTMTQAIQWMQNPTELTSLRDFAEWKLDNCDVKGQPFCSLPNACPLQSRELPRETIRLFTCMNCPRNYPWILDPTGEGLDV